MAEVAENVVQVQLFSKSNDFPSKNEENHVNLQDTEKEVLVRLKSRLYISEKDDAGEWCGKCEHSINCDDCKRSFFYNNDNWTSGNEQIDAFIRKTQIEFPGEGLFWIPYEEFSSELEFLGSGGFGSVYSATIPNGLPYRWSPNDLKFIRKRNKSVALKSLKKDRDINKLFEELEKQTMFMLKSGMLYFFVLSWGVTKNPVTDEYMIVMGKYDYDLSQFIRLPNYRENQLIPLTILWTSAAALVHLHENGFVHHDFHSRNIFVSERNLKIERAQGTQLDSVVMRKLNLSDFDDITMGVLSDFGLCSQIGKKEGEIFGVLPYIAPEVLRGKPYTEKSDVYSLGMVIWECFSGQPPYFGHPHDYHLASQILDDLRPPLLRNCPPWLAELLALCWHKDPSMRPTAIEIRDILREIVYIYRKESTYNDYQDSKGTDQTTDLRFHLQFSGLIPPSPLESDYIQHIDNSLFTSRWFDSKKFAISSDSLNPGISQKYETERWESQFLMTLD